MLLCRSRCSEFESRHPLQDLTFSVACAIISIVDIIIDQEDTIYRYKCTEQCDNCPMRYVCYTNKQENGTLRLKGHPYLDLLMVRARLDFLVRMVEYGRHDRLKPYSRNRGAGSIPASDTRGN